MEMTKGEQMLEETGATYLDDKRFYIGLDCYIHFIDEKQSLQYETYCKDCPLVLFNDAMPAILQCCEDYGWESTLEGKNADEKLSALGFNTSIKNQTLYESKDFILEFNDTYGGVMCLNNTESEEWQDDTEVVLGYDILIAIGAKFKAMELCNKEQDGE